MPSHPFGFSHSHWTEQPLREEKVEKLPTPHNAEARAALCSKPEPKPWIFKLQNFTTRHRIISCVNEVVCDQIIPPHISSSTDLHVIIFSDLINPTRRVWFADPKGNSWQEHHPVWRHADFTVVISGFWCCGCCSKEHNFLQVLNGIGGGGVTQSACPKRISSFLSREQSLLSGTSVELHSFKSN